jgi:hypothetical protein
MHLFVEQSPDCPSARIRSGNCSFHGERLTSFGWWTLAYWTGRRDADGKRVLLVNGETHGRRGWNSDGRQRTELLHALHGRDDYTAIGVSHRQIKAYASVADSDKAWRVLNKETIEKHGHVFESDKAWRKLGEELIAEGIAALRAKAEHYAKPTSDIYFRDGRDSGDVGDDVSRDARMADLSTEDTEARAAMFGIEVPNLEGELLAAREIVALGYARYNDPRKVKARERAARRGSLVRLRKAVDHVDRRSLLPIWRTPNYSRFMVEAFEHHPVEAAKLIERLSARFAMKEIDNNFQTLHPNAATVVYQRRYGMGVKYITPDRWMNGAKGMIAHDDRSPLKTYVRKEGDRVVTSRGAEVPLKDAVRLYQFATECRATGTAWPVIHENACGVGRWQEPPPEVKVGHFTLDSIDAEGNCKIGCHYLDFMEMERLAVQVVPHLVKPRYPLPAIRSHVPGFVKFVENHERRHAEMRAAL